MVIRAELLPAMFQRWGLLNLMLPRGSHMSHSESGMNVVCQPDLFRLGREDTKNVRRGLTRVKELLKAGVNVAYASNNVRDALRPMGNFDFLEEGLIIAYGAHMDTVEELETILKMSTYNGAGILGLENYGLEAGCYADLIIFDCTSPSEAIVGQAEKLYVIRRGEVLVENQRKELTGYSMHVYVSGYSICGCFVRLH